MALTPEQHLLRKTGTGGSEISAVVGSNPYKTAIDVWASKCDLAEPFEGNDATEWGDGMEAPICEYAAKKLGGTLKPATTMRHMEAHHALATPDRLIDLPQYTAVLEAKNVGGHMAHHWTDSEDGIPEYVLCQVTWEMACARVDHAIVAAAIGGRAPRIYTVHRDVELEALLLAQNEFFWEKYVVPREMPPVTGNPNVGVYLAKRYPRSTGTLLPQTPLAEEAFAGYWHARRQREAFELLEAQHENELKALIGETDGIDGLVTWKTQSGRPDWKRIALALGATKMHEKEYRTADFRAFKPKAVVAHPSVSKADAGCTEAV